MNPRALGPAVSVKAALRCGDGWVLLRNERDEWELPGGRIDPQDGSLVYTVRRECREELGIDVDVGRLVHSWLFEVVRGRRVVIVCFAATVVGEPVLSLSDEHRAVGVFGPDQLGGLNLPEGYRTCLHLATTEDGS